MALPRTTLIALAGAALLVALLSTAVAGSLTTDEVSTDRDVLAQSSTNVTAENVTVWIAPQSASSNLSNESAIDAAKESGTLTRHSRVALNDTLVFEMKVTGLDERIATVDGDNETDRFLRAVYEGEDHATLVQTNPDTHVQAFAAQFDHDSTTVVTASAEDTYYLVVELDDLSVGYCEAACPSYGDESPVVGNVSTERLPHAAFAMNLTVDGHTSTPRRDDDGDFAPLFDIADVEPDVMGAFTQSDGQTVRVPILTMLAPGTEVTVRIDDRSDGGPPLTDTATVTLDAGNEGDFNYVHIATAEFDATDVAPNATFDIEVVANGRVVETVSGSIEDASTPTSQPSTATAQTPTATETADPASTTTEAEGTASLEGADGTETSPDATEGTGPGFGPPAVLVALLATALTLRRRIA